MYNLKITTLSKGWHDKDNVLLHASFQILVDFVEKEKAGDVVDWFWNAEHRKVWKELNRLYLWWTKTRPARKDPLDDIGKYPKPLPQDIMTETNNKKYKKYYALLDKSIMMEEKWMEEDSENLHRLIDVRSFLWT